MTKTNYIKTLIEEDQMLFKVLDEIILASDPHVESKVDSIMSTKEALVYTQDGVFKYGLARNKNYYTFHSMVMYAHPTLREYIKQEGKKLKVQKGCINFSDGAHFPPELFKKFLQQSAKMDFSIVLNHYKNK